MALKAAALAFALSLAGAAHGAADADADAAVLRARAQTGDAQAALRLGMLLELGRGVPRDEAAAFRWYAQAARAGVPDAEFNVAAMLEAGRGTPTDAAAAARWYARAAVHGVARAAYDLGQMYAAGQGVALNLAMAQRWLQAARLPAARDLLAEIRDHPAASAAAANLLPPAPAPSDGGRGGVLVWNAPAEPVPVRYYVCIARLGPGGPSEEGSVLSERSAVAVARPLAGASYAWRVLAVAASSGHYAASAWQRM